MSRLSQWIKSKITRSTSTGEYIPEIDGLRFIAIFSVILFHVNWYVISKSGRLSEQDLLTSLLSHGKFGVQLFFVISGFVIALPFARAHFLQMPAPSLKKYFLRRLTRLEPPYIINLLILFILIPIVTKETETNLLPHLLASMGYLHALIYGAVSTINGVAWSLEIEMQFYILAPLLTVLFVIRSVFWRRGMLVVLISLFSFVNFMMNDCLRFDLSILSAAQYFLTGFLFIDVYLIELNRNADKTLKWDLISLSSWALICYLVYLGKTGQLFVTIPILFAYVSAFKGAWSNWFFRQPIVYIIGGMCYTYYLYHYQLISAFGRIFLRIGGLNQMPIWVVVLLASLCLIPCIILVCTFLFILFEKPFMKRDWHLHVLKAHQKA